MICQSVDLNSNNSNLNSGPNCALFQLKSRCPLFGPKIDVSAFPTKNRRAGFSNEKSTCRLFPLGRQHVQYFGDELPIAIYDDLEKIQDFREHKLHFLRHQPTSFNSLSLCDLFKNTVFAYIWPLHNFKTVCIPYWFNFK